MENKRIYIGTTALISAQPPLSDAWMDSPVLPEGEKLPTLEADYSAFVSPMEGRRMGRLSKRALATSLTVLRSVGVENPDAIITGTALGSVKDMETVMGALQGCDDATATVSPTAFMQSTHNTVSSLVAIKTHTHSYNCTWSQEALSFEAALCDAFTQLRLGRIGNALVGAFDELSDNVYAMQRRGAFFGDGCRAGEVASSVFLKTAKESEAVELLFCKTFYCKSGESLGETFSEELSALLEKSGIALSDLDLVLEGRNGNAENDKVYDDILNSLLGDTPCGEWKNLWGEGFCSSAAGFCAAEAVLRRGFAPESLFPARGKFTDAAFENRTLGEEGSFLMSKTPRKVLIVNHFGGYHFSLVLLGK